MLERDDKDKSSEYFTDLHKYGGVHLLQNNAYLPLGFLVEPELAELFDFLKTGPYIPEYGPLNEPTTNQRLYYKGEDITPVFWRKKKQDN